MSKALGRPLRASISLENLATWLSRVRRALHSWPKYKAIRRTSGAPLCKQGVGGRKRPARHRPDLPLAPVNGTRSSLWLCRGDLYTYRPIMQSTYPCSCDTCSHASPLHRQPNPVPRSPSLVLACTGFIRIVLNQDFKFCLCGTGRCPTRVDVLESYKFAQVSCQNEF